MKRMVAVLVVMGLAPLLMGAGGIQGSIPADKKVTGPTITATFVLDPHDFGVTGKARQATLRLQRGTKFESTAFEIPIAGNPFSCGCDLKLNDHRFLFQKLTKFVPFQILEELFAGLGQPISAVVEPIVTSIYNPTCSPDAENPANTPAPDNLTGPNVLITGTDAETGGTATCSAGGLGTYEGAPPIAGILGMELQIQFLVNK